MKEQKRKWFVILIAILIVGVVGLGLTYAYWTLSFIQENSNFVTSDCFHITFDGKNDINLQNAYPMSDEELYDFYEGATPYHFVIENTCDSEATAIINLETIARDNKLADEYIETILYNGEKTYSEIIKNNTESEDVYSRKKYKGKYESNSKEVKLYNYQLKNNPVNQNKILENSVTAYKLYEFKFNGKGKREFNLLQYMYQETPANENTINKTFESKITVTTAYKPTIPKNTLADRGCAASSDCTDETRVFQTDYIQNTTKIVFQNKMNAPSKFEASFDESAGKDKSVMAYVVKNEDNVTYTIYFQTDGNFKLMDGYHYFEGFKKVEAIEGLEYMDTSNVTNMGAMFSNVGRLTSLDLSHFDTSNVNNMNFMFQGASSLTSLDLSSFDTSLVVNMEFMFNGVTNLTHLDVSSFDTSSVTDMHYMFNSVSKLITLDLSAFDTSKVTNMNNMFSGMESLTSLDISSFDTARVTSMIQMFSKVENLTSLDLSHFDTSNVTNMHGMFDGMKSLTSLDLSNFNTSNVTNMSFMFSTLVKLTALDISSFDTSKVTDMTTMFGGCGNLANLNLTHFDTSKVTKMNYLFRDMVNLTSLDLSSFDTRNVNNSSFMFDHTPKLAEITYGDNFIRKEGSDINYMFSNCPANKPTHPSWDGAFTS